MRNAPFILLGIIFGVSLVLILFFVDPAFRERAIASACLIGGVLGWFAYSYVLMQKHSFQFFGSNYHTSIVSLSPLNTCKLGKFDGMDKEIELDIYGAGGAAEFKMTGGGRHGYVVVRRDLRTILPGDCAIIRVDSAAPDLYATNPSQRSGYKDIEELPEKLKKTLRTTENWHHSASKVIVFWNTPKTDLAKEIDSKSGMSWQHIAERANMENAHLRVENRALMTATTQMSQTHRNAISALKGEIDVKDEEDK